MPRANRGYQREDFTSLLSELQGNASANVQKSEDVEQSKEINEVSPAKRRRSSKMDNRDMKYAYSKRLWVLHDRDCVLVPMIPDEDFEMLEEFDTGMQFCSRCYRMALIRAGIGDDGKRIRAYLNFFDKVNASNKEIYKLTIVNHAKLKWEDMNTMLIHVNDDNWKIVCDTSGLKLLHNNYLKLEDYTRHFTTGFHEQKINGSHNINNCLNVICSYSWEQHVELMKEEAMRIELEAERSIAEQKRKEKINAMLEQERFIMNYVKMKKFSMLYFWYAFLDTEDYMANQLFVENKVRVRFRKEFARERYRVIFCKVRKKDEKSFLETLQKLRRKAILSGYVDYDDTWNDIWNED